MDKDKFETQSGGHVKQGHDESDVSVRGIVWSGVFLAVSGFFAFVLMIGMIYGLEKWEKSQEPRLTPMEQQMKAEREAPREGLGKEIPDSHGEVKPAPDWYGRGKMEDHLRRTVKDTSPLLQYDDEHDMNGFLHSEEKWLDSTGKSSDGSIHIPVSHAMDILAQRGLPQVSGPFQLSNVGAASAAYPSGAAGDGSQTMRNPAGGTR
ncbi:MAG TPA: hypothetical protein VGN44_15095 [Candidatus Angelobacter sp.]|jgi:hypothetical protein